jgi:hypothetical protein
VGMTELLAWLCEAFETDGSGPSLPTACHLRAELSELLVTTGGSLKR